ncbi:DNA repair protein RadA [Candidatus Cyrtobacter comes]|uniref:DNA repair protein RadA n=1 Tax=Candidatus Cyrtobacter comes TaxID=675776 RepID=UPI002ACD5CD0|nr:DNA repair protein RadA [Candidatus Cyrtobacter comes]
MHKYICIECGVYHSKWSGKCACGAWNSVIEESKKCIKLYNLDQEAQKDDRIPSGMNEVDRVLGGGFVKGSVVLIAGEPGVGKSTLLMQLASLHNGSSNVLYASAEESFEQLALRAKRVGVNNNRIKIGIGSQVDEIITSCRSANASMMIVDSIQTVFSKQVESFPGSVNQIRGAALEFISYAKSSGVITVIVGHVTKDGNVAGPKLLEHMVDTVIYFEGELKNDFRILRCLKNRFGSTNEVGIFEMKSKGLIEVKNPSSVFFDNSHKRASGSCTFVGIEGTRPMLMEIQALVAKSFMAIPRRSVVGWDVQRLSMMLAILSSRINLDLSGYEVYLNVVGGLRIYESAADLAVIMALISAHSGIIIPSKVAVFGEIGLSGEVRNVTKFEERVSEAANIGMMKIVTPSCCKKDIKWDINIHSVEHVCALGGLFANISENAIP